MRFTLTIECNNAAFDDDPAAEVLAALETVEGRLRSIGAIVDHKALLYDSNGNRVGSWGFSES